MTTATAPAKRLITLPKLHPTQFEIARHPARFKVVCCGRRWGKTLMGVFVVLAGNPDHPQIKGALKGGRVWWVAPTYKIAMEGWNALKAMTAQLIQSGIRCEIREADMMIRFQGGGIAEVRSSDNPQALRGAGLDGVVLDECGLAQEQAWSEALRPALAERQGWALFISTPKGHNWFWELYEFAHHSEGWMAWQRPTTDNPWVPKEEIELARSQMSPAAFAQEFEASFELIGNGIYTEFSRTRHVHRLADFTEKGQVVLSGKGAYGLDYGVRDLSTLVAIERDTAGRVWVRECWAEVGGDAKHIELAMMQMKAKYGDWKGRTDPTVGFAASQFRWNRARMGVKMSVKARDLRIGYVQSLLNLGLKENRTLPGLCFDRDGPGVLDLVREIEGYHYEEDSKGNLAVCRESHKNDDRVAAMEYAIEELVGNDAKPPVSKAKLSYVDGPPAAALGGWNEA